MKRKRRVNDMSAGARKFRRRVLYLLSVRLRAYYDLNVTNDEIHTTRRVHDAIHRAVTEMR